MQDSKIKVGFIRAERITKHFAKTFYLASLFLPRDKRLASYAVYAICRISDESVDSDTGLDKKTYLNKIKENIETVYSNNPLQDNLLLAFRFTINKYSIPKEHFKELILGMEMDLIKTRYNDFDELYSYAYRAAGVVGLIMQKILGTKNGTAEEFSVSLGVAMQITNILRDLKEDWSRERLYLPLEDMNKFKVAENDIASGNVNISFKSLMNFEINRCRNYYKKASGGFKMIPGLRERFVVIAMSEMYSAILDQIELTSYDVFSGRIKVSYLKKIFIIIKIFTRGKYLCK